MSVRMWGQVVVQATMPAEAPVMIGTLWADTSAEQLKQCTSVSPYTFVTIGGTGGGSGSGDVVGPASADDRAIAFYDGTTGKLITDLGILDTDLVLTNRQVVSGAGLTGGGDLSADRTLAVGAGTGISVAADSIAVNQAVLKLDDWAAPDDNTDLNASGSAHGLLKKLSLLTNEFLNGVGSFAAVTDADLSTSDITTGNASTSKHGFAPKATAPASGLLSVLGIGNGETVRSDKAIFDTTNPANLGTVGPGTALVAARRDHVHALPLVTDLSLIGCGVKQGSAQTGLAVNTFTTFTFSTEDFDTSTFHDNATNNSRLTVPTTGYYLIVGAMAPVNNGGTPLVGPTAFYCAIFKNATTYLAIGVGAMDTNKNSGCCVSAIVSLTAGDYVELQGNVIATSGTYNTQAADFCNFRIVYLGK